MTEFEKELIAENKALRHALVGSTRHVGILAEALAEIKGVVDGCLKEIEQMPDYDKNVLLRISVRTRHEYNK